MALERCGRPSHWHDAVSAAACLLAIDIDGIRHERD